MRLFLICAASASLLAGGAQALAADNGQESSSKGVNPLFEAKGELRQAPGKPVKPGHESDASAGKGEKSDGLAAQTGASDSKRGNAQSNPLYQDKGQSGQNPLHKD